MNKLAIIGNLTRDPVSRTVSGDVNVCSFDVAVNGRKKQDGTQDVTYFRVSAWRGLGEVCQKYLTKGQKVYVAGPVACRTYTRQDGSFGASMEITAEDFEFVSSRNDGTAPVPAASAAPVAASGAAGVAAAAAAAAPSGNNYEVVEDDDLPF